MKIIAAEFVALDGVAEDSQEWIGEFFDDQLGQDMATQTAERDMIIVGRRTYQVMAQAWPRQGTSNPTAASMNNTPKLVASSTLTDVSEWQNSTLMTGDAAAELRALKEHPGRNAMIIGSLALVRSLLDADVIDELQLLVFPVVVGKGKRLFDGEMRRLPFELAECKAFGKGVVKLVYSPKSRRTG